MSYNPSNPNGQATMANSEPVVIASDQSPIPVTDNGGSITVDGTVAVSGSVAVTGPLTDTQLRATPVPVSGTVTVQDGGGSVTVDGSVSVSNFPATQTVAATDLDIRDLTSADVVTVTGGAGQTADVKVTLDGEQVSVSNFPATQTVTGTVTANAGTGTMNVSVQNASIPVTDNGASLTVDGTVAVSNFPATQPVSGTVTIQDGGNTITVDGTVTADTELPAAVALGDSTANPTTSHIGSCIEGFNGTSWDRLRTDTALQGIDANDSVVGVLATGTGPGFSIRINPANLGTAANSASVVNVDGANSVTFAINTTTTGTVIFEGTADNTNWIALEVFEGSQDLWVSGQNITPTAGRIYQLLTQGYRQVRMRTVTTLGATVAHFVTLSAAQQFLGGMDTGPAPHNFGYTVRNFATEYTTQQTGAAIWTPTAGRRFAVTDFTISTGGSTAGVVTLWQGASADTTYTVGTDPVVFRGEFAPSANARPGVVKQFAVPFVSSTVDHLLRITTSTAMTLYVQVNGYEI